MNRYCFSHNNTLDSYKTVIFKLQVTVLLVQECIYTTDLDSKDEQRKKERLVMAEAIDKEDADVGECQNYDLELPIDEKMALTDFPW